MASPKAAAFGLHEHITAPVEFFENMGLLIQWNARACVFDFKNDLMFFGMNVDLNCAIFGCVFDRVPDQIVQHLPYPDGVGTYGR